MAGNCWVGTDDPADPTPQAKVYPTSISAVYPTIYTNMFATDYPAGIAWPLCDDTPGLGSQVNMPYETGANNIESLQYSPQASEGGYGPFMMMQSTVVDSFVVNAAGGGNAGVDIPSNIRTMVEAQIGRVMQRLYKILTLLLSPFLTRKWDMIGHRVGRPLPTLREHGL